jgi:hypothetical protein
MDKTKETSKEVKTNIKAKETMTTIDKVIL